MKVLLINPPRFNEIVANNPAFIDEERGFNPPLGLLYLASYLKKNSNHEVLVLDAQVDNLNYGSDFLSYIETICPDVIGITVMTFTLIDVLKTLQLIKVASEKIGKKIIVVLGGPHAHIFPEETLSLDNVDFVIKGEGEVPLFFLLEVILSVKIQIIS